MIRGRGVAKNIIDFAIFSGLGGTGCLSEVAAVMSGLYVCARGVTAREAAAKGRGTSDVPAQPVAGAS